MIFLSITAAKKIRETERDYFLLLSVHYKFFCVVDGSHQSATKDIFDFFFGLLIFRRKQENKEEIIISLYLNNYSGRYYFCANNDKLI